MSLLWKIGGIALACAAAFLLVRMYGSAQYKAGKTDGELGERVIWQEKAVEAADARLDGFRQGLAQQQEQETVYQRTIERVVPIERTIVERATAYAQTPDGQLVCLPTDSVLRLDTARAALFPTAPAPSPPSPVGTVPAEPEATERRWDNE